MHLDGTNCNEIGLHKFCFVSAMGAFKLCQITSSMQEQKRLRNLELR